MPNEFIWDWMCVPPKLKIHDLFNALLVEIHFHFKLVSWVMVPPIKKKLSSSSCFATLNNCKDLYIKRSTCLSLFTRSFLVNCLLPKEQSVWGMRGWRVSLAIFGVISLLTIPFVHMAVHEEPRVWNPRRVACDALKIPASSK